MARLTRRAKKPGLPPGTVVHMGDKKLDRARITILDYSASSLKEKEARDLKEALAFKSSRTTTWINIDGVHDTELVKGLGEHYGLHPLVLEDICHTDQRPKMEDFGSYIYLVLRMLSLDDKKREVQAEQISFILGKHHVISFQETHGDVFDPVRNRIRNSKGRFRKLGPDYLAYSLIDAIVDNYFVVLERIGEMIEDIEESISDKPTPGDLQDIHKLKREMIYIRKSVWPLREVISSLQRSDSGLIGKDTKVFLRDVYDHTIQVGDTVETYRDLLSGNLDVYLSTVSNRMNEIMKVLTVIATIFIPLTFLVGVYGMNFRYMPELEVWWAYPALWGIMALIAFSMVIFFRRKSWL